MDKFLWQITMQSDKKPLAGI